MPLYEEKLISPLAIRFSQDYVRTTFRDGRALEATIKEIRSKPGANDYDLVLDAPFQPIEILRYRAPGRDTDAGGEHWVTFDNRRLYCLQRAAAELWPQRVGIPVQVLYADNGSMRRKYDSVSCGRSVNVQNHLHDVTPVCHWDWEAFLEQTGMSVTAASSNSARAYKVVEKDACKAMADLAAVPVEGAGLSTLERFLMQEEAMAAARAAAGAQQPEQHSSAGGSADSVSNDSEEASSSGNNKRRRKPRCGQGAQQPQQQNQRQQRRPQQQPAAPATTNSNGDERQARRRGQQHRQLEKLDTTVSRPPRWVAVQTGA